MNKFQFLNMLCVVFQIFTKIQAELRTDLAVFCWKCEISHETVCRAWQKKQENFIDLETFEKFLLNSGKISQQNSKTVRHFME